jgi:hypothetical protein
MNEEELLEIIEEFETVSDIKEFFENSCSSKLLEPFNLTLIDSIKDKQPNCYTSNIYVKDIKGISDDLYHNKSPQEIINNEENMDNALKAIINNPDYLLEDYSKEILSFTLILYKGKKYHFLNSKNYRVLVLFVLSEICEDLVLEDVEILEYIL